jgi:hypothetical protein
VAARYRESDSLIQSASGAIGDLLMVYKKLQRLAGFTGRVVELLEAVDTPQDAEGTAEQVRPYARGIETVGQGDREVKRRARSWLPAPSTNRQTMLRGVRGA